MNANTSRAQQYSAQLKAQVDEYSASINLSNMNSYASPERAKTTSIYNGQDSTPGAAGRYASPPRSSKK